MTSINHDGLRPPPLHALVYVLDRSQSVGTGEGTEALLRFYVACGLEPGALTWVDYPRLRLWWAVATN